MSLRLTLGISRRYKLLGYHFSLILTFHSSSPFPHPRLLPSFILTSFHLFFARYNFLFSHLHICCSLVLLRLVWLHFRLLPCSFGVQDLNAWFDNLYLFSLQEVNNFVKFIKNSSKFIFDSNFLLAS